MRRGPSGVADGLIDNVEMEEEEEVEEEEEEEAEVEGVIVDAVAEGCDVEASSLNEAPGPTALEFELEYDSCGATIGDNEGVIAAPKEGVAAAPPGVFAPVAVARDGKKA